MVCCRAQGIIYLILTLVGVFSLIIEISPKVMVGPTIMVFGVMLGQECTRFMPRRHHGIIFFALFFAFCDYFVTNFGVPMGTLEGIGVNTMKRGALLICMIWSGLLSYAIDCRWIPAAVCACIGAIFSFFGVIHQLSMNMEEITTGSMAAPLDGSTFYMASPLQFALGYLTIAVACLLWHFMQNSPMFDMPKPIMPGSEEEKKEEALETGHMLFSIGNVDDWWAKGPGAKEATAVPVEVSSA